jgi:FkbM family methyltransferase
MAHHLVEEVLHAGSRVKRSIHRATAPRTPVPATEAAGRPAEEIDALVGLLFPAGISDESVESVRGSLGTGDLTATSVRHILGQVDQQRSPTPFSVRLSAGDVTYVPLDGIEVALDQADGSVSAPIIETGAWEPHVERVLRSHLAPGSVFVDIGANVGWHSALAAAIVGPTGAVYAIEPNPDNARLIAHTIDRNHLQHVHLLPFALSDGIGYAAFRSAIGSNGGFTGGGADYVDPSVTIVPTIRLDDLDIPRVDVIKLDVEGAEPMVLRGASATLQRDHPVIVFEFSCEMTQRVGGVEPRDHLALFQSYGYELSLIEQPTGTLVAVPDIDALLRDWGNPLRIEDIVAVHPAATLH